MKKILQNKNYKDRITTGDKNNVYLDRHYLSRYRQQTNERNDTIHEIQKVQLKLYVNK